MSKKTNLIENELRRKVQKVIKNQISEGVDLMLKDMPRLGFETIRFDLHENSSFSVFDDSNGRIYRGELRFDVGTDDEKIKNFLYSVLSKCFEEKLLNASVEDLIRKATLLD